MMVVSNPYMCWGGTVATMKSSLASSSQKRAFHNPAPLIRLAHALGLGLGTPVLPEVKGTAARWLPGIMGGASSRPPPSRVGNGSGSWQTTWGRSSSGISRSTRQ